MALIRTWVCGLESTFPHELKEIFSNIHHSHQFYLLLLRSWANKAHGRHNDGDQRRSRQKGDTTQGQRNVEECSKSFQWALLQTYEWARTIFIIVNATMSSMNQYVSNQRTRHVLVLSNNRSENMRPNLQGLVWWGR